MNTLHTKRLVLRKWKGTDSNDLFEYAKSNLVGPNAGWLPHKDEEESKKIIKHFLKNDETLAIVLKEEQRVIGSIGLHSRSDTLYERELGYVLNPKYWGQGIVPEAVHCIIDYGFSKLKLEKIWCSHFDFNHNSKRVIEKCDFEFEFKKKVKLSVLGNREVYIYYYSKEKN